MVHWSWLLLAAWAGWAVGLIQGHRDMVKLVRGLKDGSIYLEGPEPPDAPVVG